MSEIEIAGDLVSQHCCFERSALILKRTMTWEECKIIANMLYGMHTAIAWYLGDLMNYTESQFGEEYAQLFSDWAPHTLANWRWVSKQVPLSRRRDGLSWSHHAEVAGLPPDAQERWLTMAEAEKWTRSDLRRALMPDEDKAGKPTGTGQIAPRLDEQVQSRGKARGETITCPFCGQQWEATQ